MTDDALARYLEEPTAEHLVEAAEEYDLGELEDLSHKANELQELADSYRGFQNYSEE